jgi:diketogulonate reductase-like aldo/keto reductase
MARIPASPELRRFATYRQGVEAVLQRCGIDTFDLLLIDVDGNWTRGVFPSKETAAAVADDLGVPLNDGWTDRMVKRMNRRDHWNDPGGQQRAL